MDGIPHPVSPDELYAHLGTGSAPVLVDVRRAEAFDTDDRLVIGALHRAPEDVEHNWMTRASDDRPYRLSLADQSVHQSQPAGAEWKQRLPLTMGGNPHASSRLSAGAVRALHGQ